VLKILYMPLRWVMVAVCIYSGVAAAGGLNLEEGYWETHVSIGIQGGILAVPAIKSGKCITRQDPLPNSVESSRMHCRVFDKSIVGNDVSWRLECGDEKGKMEGQGKITYAGDSFSGKMEVLVTEIGGDRHAKLEYVMKGERARECRATDPK
jgi:Protein of unknown function (DUF3617)